MAVKENDSKKKSSTKKTVKKNNSKKSTERSELDVTTRIRVDDVRINDAESLDVSFLEGKSKKKANKNTKKVKKNILNDKKKSVDIENIFKIIILIAVSLAVVIVICFLIKNNFKDKEKTKKQEKVVVEEKKEEKEVIMDRNYLFVGDFYTEEFPFDEFDLDYHYVKSSDDDLTTDSLFDDIESSIYIYNPSIIFISVGFNDLYDGKDIDDVISNLDEIIDSIQNNRQYAEIYIESLYPINDKSESFDKKLVGDNIDNDLINKFNKKLLSLTKKKKVNYLDVYSMLEKKGALDLDYTDDGVNLNLDGYKQVMKVINKIID